MCLMLDPCPDNKPLRQSDIMNLWSLPAYGCDDDLKSPG